MRAFLFAELCLVFAISACAVPTGGRAENLSSPVYELVNDASGLHYSGQSYAMAVADLDGNGWVDLVLTNHHRVLVFFNTEGEFSAPQLVSGNTSLDSHGISVWDANLDGRLDFSVSVGANRGFGQGNNQVFRQQPDGSFAPDHELAAPFEDPKGRGRCAVLFDFTGDGRVDVAWMNAVQKDRMHKLFVGTSDGFVDATSSSGIEDVGAECMTAVSFEAGQAPLFVTYGVGPQSGHVFRWTDEARFEDVSKELGLTWSGTTQSVAVGDYDNDGDLDLYYMRGHGNPSSVEKTSSSTAEVRLLARGEKQRVGARFEVDGKLEFELQITGPWRPDLIRRGPDMKPVTSKAFSLDPSTIPLGPPKLEGDASDPGVLVWSPERGVVHLELLGDGGPRQMLGGKLHCAGPCFGEVELFGDVQPSLGQANTLLAYDAGKLVDVTEVAGVTNTLSARDAVFFDAENDGDLDLFLVNSGTRISNLPDSFFLNRGDGTFEESTERSGIRPSERGRGQSVAVLDRDRDGALELLIANGCGPWPGNEGPLQLWSNTSSTGRWAELEILGCGHDPAAFGTFVEVDLGDRKLAVQRSSTNGKFASSISPLHIGLGKKKKARAVIYWTDGSTERVRLKASKTARVKAPWCRDPS